MLFKNYIMKWQEVVDREIEARLPSTLEEPRKLHEAMRYSMLSGGKRIRPVLCIASAEAVGDKTKDALLPALSIEALHTYTLVHDDLPAMDDDDMRRGKPSCHKKYGEATAILVGDALLTLAFEWMGKTENPKLSVELAFATGSRGTVGGQHEDIENKNEFSISEQTLQFIHRNKTAALFRASTRIGAICGRASEEQLKALSIYGDQIGLAFQLVDDVIDKDQFTYSLYGAEGAIRRAQVCVDKAIQAIDNVSLKTDILHDATKFILAQVTQSVR